GLQSSRFSTYASQELYKKWKGRHVANWAMVRNQLLMDDRMSQLMQQYDVAY
ncbi:transposase mutator type, partial [Megasphaera sp. BL7]